MGKSKAEIQKAYIERLKSKNKADYLKKERERKKSKLQLIKNDQKDEYMEHLKQDRERKAAARRKKKQVCFFLILKLFKVFKCFLEYEKAKFILFVCLWIIFHNIFIF